MISIRSGQVFLLGLLMGLAGSGCGKGDSGGGGDDSPAPSPVSGVFGGKEWTYAAGRLEQPDPSLGISEWNFKLVADVQDNVCEPFILVGTDHKELVFLMEPVVGRSEVEEGNAGLTLFFSDSTPGAIDIPAATSGYVEIQTVETGRVTGILDVTANPDNAVKGNFDLVRCCLASDGKSHTVCAE